MRGTVIVPASHRGKLRHRMAKTGSPAALAPGPCPFPLCNAAALLVVLPHWTFAVMVARWLPCWCLLLLLLPTDSVFSPLRFLFTPPTCVLWVQSLVVVGRAYLAGTAQPWWLGGVYGSCGIIGADRNVDTEPPYDKAGEKTASQRTDK